MYLHRIKQLVNLFLHTLPSVLSMVHSLKTCLQSVISNVLCSEILDLLKFPHEDNMAHKRHDIMVTKKTQFNKVHEGFHRLLLYIFIAEHMKMEIRCSFMSLTLVF